MRSFVASLVAIASAVCAPAAAAQTSFLTPPVDAVLSQGFVRPGEVWDRGHRGIDYEIPFGTPVRAAGAGTVTFAGHVAGRPAVTIDHGAGIETTYTWLSDVYVSEGEAVAESGWIGASGWSHDLDEGLHLGMKLHGSYVDPTLHLGPVDASSAIWLAPLEDEAPDARSHYSNRGCRVQTGITTDPPPPNDNVLVLIGGITSATDGSGAAPNVFTAGPALGYAPSLTYHFSYRGAEGPRFHEPYGRKDTYGDLSVAAMKLRELMKKIAKRHPGADVDIVAHSLGGIVARTYLAHQNAEWDPDLPRVEHFVSFASPHQGSALADELDEVRSRLVRKAADVILDLAWERDWGIPAPRSMAVHQLRPESMLMGSLASQDVAFGTRVLALGSSTDVFVPAERASLPGKPSLRVGVGGFAHKNIVTSEGALGTARAFLAGAPYECVRLLFEGPSPASKVVDEVHSLVGEGINWVTSIVPF